MTLIDSVHEPRLKHNYLVKTIMNSPGGGGWNTWLASVTIVPGAPQHPLSRLRLRQFPRPYTPETQHLIEEEGQTKIVARKRVPNPNQVEAVYRPYVTTPEFVYPANKSDFSKFQSTTMISEDLNVHPKLFNWKGQAASGVCIPFDNNFCLVNRLFKTADRPTFGRFFDTNIMQGDPMTLQQLQRGEGIANTEKHNEVLARIRLYVRGQTLTTHLPPGILLVYDENPSIYLPSIYSTLLRFFDLKFCLLRNFGENVDIPIYVYQHNAPHPLSFRPFNGYEEIENVLDDFLPNGAAIFKRDYLPYFQRIVFIQGLFQFRIKDPAHPVILNFDAHLHIKPNGRIYEHSFYIETLRVFCDFMKSITSAERGKYDPFYLELFRTISEGTEVEQEERFIIWTFYADYGPFVPFGPPRSPEIIQKAFLKTRVEAPLPPREGEFWPGAPVSPLWLAVSLRDFSTVRKLLTGHYPKLDVNTPDHMNRFTPLYVATLQQDVPMVKLLLSNPHINRNFGFFKESYRVPLVIEDVINSPLHGAIFAHNPEIVKLLLVDQGTNVNMPGEHGVQPLLRACFQYRDGFTDKISSDEQKKRKDIIVLILKHPNVNFNASANFLTVSLAIEPKYKTAFVQLILLPNIPDVTELKNEYIKIKTLRGWALLPIEENYCNHLSHEPVCNKCHSTLLVGFRNHCHGCLHSFCDRDIYKIPAITRGGLIKCCFFCRNKIFLKRL